ncbi:Palmitoyl-protein thioesterase 1 [Sphaceloma murrayae]|uniref:Palmitoyl-protein thioesterase 1 n=1 Tax=Sphaceloma murrayae TaxID=2082308 RepID=A0A2K1R186_9PEZI|nr:Palmitoyl-protein thioesterase 1 [Sphaceloma murrayae]
MARLSLLALLPLLFPAALTTPVPSPTQTPLPVVLWHGLGDRSDADGLSSVADLLQVVHPGTKVHIVSLGDDGAADQRASFFGKLSDQVSSVCDELSSSPIFSSKTGPVDFLGFSQGGLFLRGLAETCPGIRVRSLVTFGSPHNGIADLPACGTWDLLCKGAEGALKGNKWSEWVQSNVVPAQYFRETDEKTGLGSEAYLEGSGWLADVNNERDIKDEKYRGRLGVMERFVMYGFEEDQTLMPKETAWFSEVNGTSGEVVPLRERAIYWQDWLGLKILDDKDALVFRMVKKAEHMQLSDKLLRKAFSEFFGPERELDAVADEEEVDLSLWSSITNLKLQDISLVGGDW